MYISLFVSPARRSSIIFSATVSSASSQLMGTNFGSMPRPLTGLVRFIGVFTRSGSYICCGIMWPRGQT